MTYLIRFIAELTFFHASIPRLVYDKAAGMPTAHIEQEWELCGSSDAGSDDCIISCTDKTVLSAPGRLYVKQCLVPGFHFTLTSSGDQIAVDKASELLAGAGGKAQILRCTTQSERERDIVEIRYARAGSAKMLLFTATHSLKVRRTDGKMGALPAADLRCGDFLLTRLGAGRVEQVLSRTLKTVCFEVELRDRSSTFFVGSRDFDADDFVQVFGELAPRPMDDYVKVLRFRHFQGFKDLLFNCEALQVCRNDMDKCGYSADLNACQLGPGKMFVNGQMAERVVHTLKYYQLHGKLKLTPRDVVVSRAYERAVLDVVQHEVGDLEFDEL